MIYVPAVAHKRTIDFPVAHPHPNYKSANKKRIALTI